MNKTNFNSNIPVHIQDVIREWELDTGKRLPNSLAPIVRLANTIHIKEKRGLTREDIIAKLGYTEGYAKKILYNCQNIKLLVPLDGYKQGRFNEYFISTEIHKFLERQRHRQNDEDSIEQLSAIQIIVNEITQRKPTFHKFFLHFDTLPLEKDATFEDAIYKSLLAKDNWIVKSQKNKAKVKSFNLESKRSCTIQVYPKGKVIVMVECSYRPFKLHEEEGSQEFWKSIGKVEIILDQEFQTSLILPPSGQWLLKGYDRDVTIPESDLVKKYPYITQWYSKEGIQLRALGRVFQIYGKIMPICGKCLRIEERVSIKEDIPLEQGIREIAADVHPLEIIRAFDMLSDERRKESG